MEAADKLRVDPKRTSTAHVVSPARLIFSRFLPDRITYGSFIKRTLLKKLRSGSCRTGTRFRMNVLLQHSFLSFRTSFRTPFRPLSPRFLSLSLLNFLLSSIPSFLNVVPHPDFFPFLGMLTYQTFILSSWQTSLIPSLLPSFLLST